MRKKVRTRAHTSSNSKANQGQIQPWDVVEFNGKRCHVSRREDNGQLLIYEEGSPLKLMPVSADQVKFLSRPDLEAECKKLNAVLAEKPDDDCFPDALRFVLGTDENGQPGLRLEPSEEFKKHLEAIGPPPEPQKVSVSLSLCVLGPPWLPLLLGFLRHWRNAQGKRDWFSCRDKDIADNLHVPQPTVERWMREIRERGFIRIQEDEAAAKGKARATRTMCIDEEALWQAVEEAEAQTGGPSK